MAAPSRPIGPVEASESVVWQPEFTERPMKPTEGGMARQIACSCMITGEQIERDDRTLQPSDRPTRRQMLARSGRSEIERSDSGRPCDAVQGD